MTQKQYELIDKQIVENGDKIQDHYNNLCDYKDSLEAKIQELEKANYVLRTDRILANKYIQELELIIKGKDVIIESMAQGKSCDTCRWDGTRSGALARYCDELLTFVPKDFYCARYEPKENQDVK